MEKARRLEIGPDEGDIEDDHEDNAHEFEEAEERPPEDVPSSSGVPAIRFGIKKNEPPPSNIAPVNVLDQCKFTQ